MTSPALVSLPKAWRTGVRLRPKNSINSCSVGSRSLAGKSAVRNALAQELLQLVMQRHRAVFADHLSGADCFQSLMQLLAVCLIHVSPSLRNEDSCSATNFT